MQNYHRLEEIPYQTHRLGRLRLISSANIMVFWGEVNAGSHIERHSHPNEQLTWLISGAMDYRIADGDVRRCNPGDVVTIPAGTMHETWYRERCEILEVFNPPRFDLFPAAASHPYGSPSQDEGATAHSGPSDR